MDCYGRLFNKRTTCELCKLSQWCKNASDPPLLSQQMVDWNVVSEVVIPANMIVEHPAGEMSLNKGMNQNLYSRDDLLEVIGFLLSLDTQTLDMLDSKVGNPGISFSEIARQRGVSRQAVHNFIKKKCAQIPELSIILQNNSQKRKLNKSFMEEVCLIRKKMLEKKLKKQKEDSKFLRKLSCWSQNLDLSEMSIFKGSSIITNVLSA